jgi:hypothetical protein
MGKYDKSFLLAYFPLFREDQAGVLGNSFLGNMVSGERGSSAGILEDLCLLLILG